MNRGLYLFIGTADITSPLKMSGEFSFHYSHYPEYLFMYNINLLPQIVVVLTSSIWKIYSGQNFACGFDRVISFSSSIFGFCDRYRQEIFFFLKKNLIALRRCFCCFWIWVLFIMSLDLILIAWESLIRIGSERLPWINRQT